MSVFSNVHHGEERPNRGKRKQLFYREAVCELMALGMPMHLSGFDYLTTAIALTAEDPSYLHNVTKRLYPDVAAEYNSLPERVERCMRTAIEAAFLHNTAKKLTDYFGDAVEEKSGKVKNSVFVAAVARDIRIRAMGAEAENK